MSTNISLHIRQIPNDSKDSDVSYNDKDIINF